jgi:excisionase family DNA binding protein
LAQIFLIPTNCHLVKDILSFQLLFKTQIKFYKSISYGISPIKTSLGIFFALKLMKLTANERNSMSLMETDSVLTTDQAIEYLKISKPTFLKYVRLGRIRAIKAGKGWRVLQSELYRFLRGKTDIGDI